MTAIYIVIGMAIMWTFLSVLIALGDNYFGQDILWDDWWAFIILLPAILLISPFTKIICPLVRKYRQRQAKKKIYKYGKLHDTDF